MHLFEFEDLIWFPDLLRVLMTRYINTIHRILGSSSQITSLLDGILRSTGERHILDRCSGSGGPMPEVLKLLRTKYGLSHLKLTMSDLYPNLVMAETINNRNDPGLYYQTEPVDVLNQDTGQPGLRTFIYRFHHLLPDKAKGATDYSFWVIHYWQRRYRS